MGMTTTMTEKAMTMTTMTTEKAATTTTTMEERDMNTVERREVDMVERRVLLIIVLLHIIVPMITMHTVHNQERSYFHKKKKNWSMKLASPLDKSRKRSIL